MEQLFVLFVLLLGVGLGTAAGAFVTRPTEEEEQAWSYWVARKSRPTGADTVTTGSGEPQNS